MCKDTGTEKVLNAVACNPGEESVLAVSPDGHCDLPTLNKHAGPVGTFWIFTRVTSRVLTECFPN